MPPVPGAPGSCEEESVCSDIDSGHVFWRGGDGGRVSGWPFCPLGTLGQHRFMSSWVNFLPPYCRGLRGRHVMPLSWRGFLPGDLFHHSQSLLQVFKYSHLSTLRIQHLNFSLFIFPLKGVLAKRGFRTPFAYHLFSSLELLEC